MVSPLPASWGQDDFWDVALRYAGDLGPFKVSAGLSSWRDLGRLLSPSRTVCNGRSDAPAPRRQRSPLSPASIRIANSSVDRSASSMSRPACSSTPEPAPSSTTSISLRRCASRRYRSGRWAKRWSVQAGIEKKIIDHGKTTIYGGITTMTAAQTRGEMWLLPIRLRPLPRLRPVGRCGAPVYRSMALV